MKFGNFGLIPIYSIALLALGCAIGAKWGQTPSIAVGMVLLGAVMMVIHDALTALGLFWVLRIMTQRLERRAASGTSNGW